MEKNSSFCGTAIPRALPSSVVLLPGFPLPTDVAKPQAWCRRSCCPRSSSPPTSSSLVPSCLDVFYRGEAPSIHHLPARGGGTSTGLCSPVSSTPKSSQCLLLEGLGHSSATGTRAAPAPVLWAQPSWHLLSVPTLRHFPVQPYTHLLVFLACQLPSLVLKWGRPKEGRGHRASGREKAPGVALSLDGAWAWAASYPKFPSVAVGQRQLWLLSSPLSVAAALL